ncbi:hypothetical protein [Pseudothioclava arenosa]|uniref:hypothetical protein n=1 Tax=Pseudothioclava arenosa TaxID=1795308 RepID=UPI0015CEA38A|nr:hypothetical protein [Pseudothioclava arenosa]
MTVNDTSLPIHVAAFTRWGILAATAAMGDRIALPGKHRALRNRSRCRQRGRHQYANENCPEHGFNLVKKG